MTANRPSPEEVLLALIDQVVDARASAMMQGKNETYVVTIISRPMWEIFLKAMDKPPGTKPTAWIGPGTIRVYGSETHVIEDSGFWSASRCRES